MDPNVRNYLETPNSDQGPALYFGPKYATEVLGFLLEYVFFYVLMNRFNIKATRVQIFGGRISISVLYGN